MFGDRLGLGERVGVWVESGHPYNGLVKGEKGGKYIFNDRRFSKKLVRACTS
jgi:hypothetical protein